MDSLKLLEFCACDTGDTELWSEFLRRFAPRIRVFIRGTLRQSRHIATGRAAWPGIMGQDQEDDLFQSTIVRLVENGCAALKRFSGASEADFLAYLAVISRSVVRDFQRRQLAQKRPSNFKSPRPIDSIPAEASSGKWDHAQEAIDRAILGREVRHLSLNTINGISGSFSARDRLIFKLYFFDGLSVAQVSRCAGIELSETGVKKVIRRLKEFVRSAASAGPSEVVLR